MSNSVRPEPGLVIRFDFLFHLDSVRGVESGKDRPTAIVIALPQKDETGQSVILAPITHTPPSPSDPAIPLPAAVARRLGLDDQPMWIKPRELNRFSWPESRVPFGLTPVKPGQWSYGYLPPDLYTQLKQAVLAEVKARRANITDR